MGRTCAGRGRRTAGVGAGCESHEHFPAHLFLAAYVASLFLTHVSTQEPDACGGPESACGRISSPADSPATILPSTHLDLWCNCIIWEEFLYKSLNNKRRPKALHDGKRESRRCLMELDSDQALHVGLFTAVVGRFLVFLTFWSCTCWRQGATWEHDEVTLEEILVAPLCPKTKTH